MGSHSLFSVIRVFRKDLSMKNCAKVNKHGSQWHICSSENICYIFNCWNCSECLTYSFPGLSNQPHNLHFLTLKFIIFFWQRIQQVYLLYCLLAWLLPSSQHHKAKTASSSTRSAYTPHMCFYCQLYLIASLQFLLMLC